MINAEKARIDKLLSNNEIQTIITALGTGFGGDGNDTDTESDSGTDDGSETGKVASGGGGATNAKNAKNGKTPDTLYERQLRSGPIGEARATEKQIAWLFSVFS